MQKFIPYEKLSKKEKRKIDAAKRATWGELNPVTRKPENSKAYNRSKSRNWKREISRQTNSGTFFFAAIRHNKNEQYCGKIVTTNKIAPGDRGDDCLIAAFVPSSLPPPGR